MTTGSKALPEAPSQGPPQLVFTDTHCHLDAAEFDGDRDAAYQSARAAGVSQLVVPAVAVSNFSAVRDCCQRYPGCQAAYGIHPLFTPHYEPEHIAILKDWLVKEKPVAVGEIGLDHYVPTLDPALQEACFVAQLKLARELNLPVILHVRRAVDAVLKQLRRIPVPGGIAHAFNGSRQQAETFIAMGFKLGFGGAMTFPGATRIRELARSLPLEAIVLETDAPDIAPAWLNGGRNAPDQLPAIAAVLAQLRGMSIAEVAQVTTANAAAALGLK